MGVSKVVQGDRYCKNGGHQSLKPCKRMALRESPSSAESDLFRQELVNLINLRQPLVQLAQKIDCKSCQGGFDTLYATGMGGPGHPIRLMGGLQLLKHTRNAGRAGDWAHEV